MRAYIYTAWCGGFRYSRAATRTVCAAAAVLLMLSIDAHAASSSAMPQDGLSYSSYVYAGDQSHHVVHVHDRRVLGQGPVAGSKGGPCRFFPTGGPSGNCTKGLTCDTSGSPAYLEHPEGVCVTVQPGAEGSLCGYYPRPGGPSGSCNKRLKCDKSGVPANLPDAAGVCVTVHPGSKGALCGFYPVPGGPSGNCNGRLICYRAKVPSDLPGICSDDILAPEGSLCGEPGPDGSLGDCKKGLTCKRVRADAAGICMKLKPGNRRRF